MWQQSDYRNLSSSSGTSNLNAHSTTSSSNIPLSTSVTTSAHVSVLHSSQTLNAPISTRIGNNSNKAFISKQPVMQETGHVVGIGGSSEMQSNVQFSISPHYQASVAAATLSQGGLGHSQNSSAVHHTLPEPAQARRKTLIVHPIRTYSQAHAAVQMQGYQHQKLKVEDALSYLDQVKYRFGNQPQIYNDFLDIMKEFKSLSIDAPSVIERVCNLFRGYPELIVGFNTFLPLGYRIEVHPNEQVQVSIPGANIGSGINTGSISSKILPDGLPSTSPFPFSNTFQSNHTTLSHSSPENAVNKSSNYTPPVANSQSHSNSLVYTRCSNESSLRHNTSNTSETSTPADFNHAINYINKLKNRFQEQPHIYNKFLDIFHTFQKEQKDIKDGICIGGKTLTEAEVYAQAAKLLQNHDDLLKELGQFLPNPNGDASALIELQPSKAVNKGHVSVKPYALVKPIIPSNNQAKKIQVIKRPVPSILSPSIKITRTK